MQKLYLNESNRLKPIDESHEATHVHMTIDEYNDLVNATENLRRILTEKANAERGIIPKKERSGYIMLGYDSYTMRFNFENGTQSLPVRRLLLETPYSIESEYFETEKLVYNDIDQHLYDNLKADGFMEIDEIDKDILKELGDGNNNILIIGHLEMQRSNQWGVRLYTNYTPVIPSDLIKENNKKSGGKTND